LQCEAGGRPLVDIRHFSVPWTNLLFVSEFRVYGQTILIGASAIFCPTVTQRSPFLCKNGLPSFQTQMGDENMRVLIICALVITATVGVSGCFHHQKAVTQEPLKLG
jgi:hypothetical protein